MDRKNVKEKRIGNTVYIIESVVGSAARETVHDKLKRMILNEANDVTDKQAS